MKSSSKFATENGESHFPANMKHVDVDVRSFRSAADMPMVIFELQDRTREKLHVLRVRMSRDEAKKLAADLLQEAGGKEKGELHQS
jgi:hypothetical protein